MCIVNRVLKDNMVISHVSDFGGKGNCRFQYTQQISEYLSFSEDVKIMGIFFPFILIISNSNLDY